MIDSVIHSVFQFLHIAVFGFLLFSKEWRPTAILLILSALAYLYIEAFHVGAWIDAKLYTKDYTVSAWLDGFVAFLLVAIIGNRHAMIQGGILTVFALLHISAAWTYSIGSGIIYNIYGDATFLLNVAQLFFGVMGIKNLAFTRDNSFGFGFGGSDSQCDKNFTLAKKENKE